MIASRKSCVECVEKHIGAACVLMGEVDSGYPHRLRAIGHLHEAEDESRKWPRLNQAIRKCRKEFQNRGEAPNWDKLERQVNSVRSRAILGGGLGLGQPGLTETMAAAGGVPAIAGYVDQQIGLWVSSRTAPHLKAMIDPKIAKMLDAGMSKDQIVAALAREQFKPPPKRKMPQSKKVLLGAGAAVVLFGGLLLWLTLKK